MNLHKQLTGQRVRAYASVFGELGTGFIDTDTSGACPPVDLFHFPPGPGGRPYFTLVTSGMSDRPMNVPAAFPADRRRAEILIYAKELKDEYFLWIKWAAKFPFIDNTYLDHGHTIQWHEPLFPGSQLSCMVFLHSLIRGDRDLCDTLSVEGDPVNMLWFVPITRAEWALKQRVGIDGLLDVFDQYKHPLEVNEQRQSYV